jgi:hypothetical protein
MSFKNIINNHALYLQRVWPVLIIIFLAYLLSPIKTENVDIWLHYGRLIFDQKSFTVVDSSLLQDKVIFFPTILVSTIYHLLHSTFGYRAIALFHTIVLYFILFYTLKNIKELTYLFFLVTISSLFLIFPFLLTGPECIAYLCFLIGFDQITHESRLKNIVILSVVYLIWCLSHPSFLIFFLFQGISLVEKTKKSGFPSRGLLISLLITTAFATLFLFSYNLLEYARLTREFSTFRGIVQWMPFFSVADIFQGVALTVITASVVKFIYKKVTLFMVVQLSILLVMSLISYRFLPWLVFSILPLFFEQSSSNLMSRAFPRCPVIFRYVLILLFGAIMVYRMVHWDTDHSLANKHIALLRNPGVRIFNEWSLGGELLTKNIKRITIDNRNTIFNKAEFENYRSIISGDEKSLALIEKMDYDYLVLTDKPKNLIRRLRKSNYTELSSTGYFVFKTPPSF